MNNTPIEQEHNTQTPHHVSFWKSLLTSSEGHILLTGVGVVILYALWLIMNSVWNPQRFQVLIAMTATHVLFGRAAGMSFGYTVQLGHGTVVLANMVIESIILLLFYPLFVFSWRHLLIIPALKHMMNRIRKAADAHRHSIRRYGLLGLFVFVWIPFWMTGSLVGCVIGFLLGLHAWLNIGVVLGGSWMAILSWALILRKLHDKVAGISPYAPLLILAAIILIAVLERVISAKKQERTHDEYAIMAIHPYRYDGMWVFDDEAVGLRQEPFISGADTVIDYLVMDIPDAEHGFHLLFSAAPFPGYQTVFDLQREECGGNWYYSQELNREGWLCPALYKYFETAPAKIYTQFKAREKC